MLTRGIYEGNLRELTRGTLEQKQQKQQQTTTNKGQQRCVLDQVYCYYIFNKIVVL